MLDFRGEMTDNYLGCSSNQLSLEKLSAVMVIPRYSDQKNRGIAYGMQSGVMTRKMIVSMQSALQPYIVGEKAVMLYRVQT